MDRKQLVSFSEIASFLRVPLMVLVVCIHGVGSDIQTIDFVNHLSSTECREYIYIYFSFGNFFTKTESSVLDLYLSVTL